MRTANKGAGSLSWKPQANRNKNVPSLHYLCGSHDCSCGSNIESFSPKMHQRVADFVLCLADIFIHVLKQLQKGVKNKNRPSVWCNCLNPSASVYGGLDREAPASAGSLMCFPRLKRKAEMEDRRDISHLPCKHIKICCSRTVNKCQVCLLLQAAPTALATPPHQQRSKCFQKSP